MRRQLAVSALIFCVVLLACCFERGRRTLFQTSRVSHSCTGCKFEPKQRVQTGFRIKDQPGIITALHGVADCSSIVAESGDLDRNLRLKELIVAKLMSRPTQLCYGPISWLLYRVRGCLWPLNRTLRTRCWTWKQ